MTTEARLIALTQAIGADIKEIKTKSGDLSTLSTVAKTSLVAAINEIVNSVGQAGVKINDSATDGDLLVTWSANKIFDEITLAAQTVKDSILGGASAAFDTLLELQEALGNDSAFATTIANGLNNRIRFDAAQVLTEIQKKQARDNIDSPSQADMVAAKDTREILFHGELVNSEYFGDEAISLQSGMGMLYAKTTAVEGALGSRIDSKIDSDSRGTANGVAPLDADQKIPMSFFPVAITEVTDLVAVYTTAKK